jgi:putative ABC transport system permease protein
LLRRIGRAICHGTCCCSAGSKWFGACMSPRQAIDNVAQEARYAIRGFRRSPLFTLSVIVTVALGVGPNTAVYSVIDRILFRNLPYPHDDRLVSFGMVAPIAPQEFMLGYDYLDWREAHTPFASMGAWSGERDCDLTIENPVRLRCANVDAALLPTLGLRPVLGRNFAPQEDERNAPPVALISYALWRSRFAGDPRVIGKPLPLDGQAPTIIGVLPAQFELPTLARADVLVPLGLDREEQRTRKTAILLWTVARLKAGLTPAQAGAALQPLFDTALRRGVSPEFWKEIKLRIRPLRDRQIQDARLASWILVAAVLAVLAIACANVSNLLLARSTGRRREFAVRAALGAGRGRRAAQALLESMLAGLAGGALGCLLAAGLLRLFVAIAPEGIPRLSQATVDLRVLLFTLVLSLASGALFGLAPALQSPRAEMLTGSRTLGSRHHRFRHILVMAQISVSLVLVAGAGLLLRSLWGLQNQPLGMRTEGVVAASVNLGAMSYSNPAGRLAFFERLEQRLRRVPGVREIAICNWPPPLGNQFGPMLYAGLEVPGRPKLAAGTGGTVTTRSVTPGYFGALGIPTLRGRVFNEADRDPNRHAIVLSDALARRLFPGEDPVGKQIRLWGRGPWLTVIGVVGNVKNNGLAGREDAEFYEVRKHAAEDVERSATAFIRTAMDPRLTMREVRREFAALDPTLPVDIATLQQRVSELAAGPRFNALLLGFFAALGLALAAIGVYGLVAFLVIDRTPEIGVRMALGSSPGGIVRLILREAGGWTAAGAAVGTAGALFTNRLLEAMLFGVSWSDPWTLAVAVCVLFGAALAAASIPARNAARVDPLEALRRE